MFSIGVPNLSKINPQEGFFLAQSYFLNRCEEGKYEENWAILEMHISITTGLIFYKFGM